MAFPSYAKASAFADRKSASADWRSEGRPPPRGGLIGYAMTRRPGGLLGYAMTRPAAGSLGVTQAGGLLSTKSPPTSYPHSDASAQPPGHPQSQASEYGLDKDCMAYCIDKCVGWGLRSEAPFCYSKCMEECKKW